VALHSTDPVTVHLSAALRMRTPSVAAVERALYDDRTLVRHHGMRRTLWVATPDVIRLVHAAATRRLFAVEHRRTAKLLAESGEADPDGWLAGAGDHVVSTLHEQGPLSARQLGERVPELRRPLVLAAGTRNEVVVAAHTRVLLQLGFEGRVVRARPVGSWVSGQYTYAAVDTWLPGGFDGPTEREAARELADRWLRRFGPATTADLRWWTGWTATLTKQALADCDAVPVVLEVGPGAEPEPGWVAAGDEGEVEAVGPWVALLPGLDPTTMGWKQRGWYVPEECAGVFDRNGNAGPTVWADGRVVGAWMQAADGRILTELMVDVPRRVRDAVAEEAERVRAVLGDTRVSVRFLTPDHRSMLAGKPAAEDGRRG
jgi:hypothetical protein